MINGLKLLRIILNKALSGGGMGQLLLLPAIALSA